LFNHEHHRRTLLTLHQVTAAQAIESKSPVLGYNASKKLAEQAAWQYMKDAQPSFDLTVINPDIVTGPMLQVVSGPNAVNETNAFAIYGFLNGTYKDIPKFPYQHFVCLPLSFPDSSIAFMATDPRKQVDVRDVARAHILSLTSPAASNQRILLVSGLILPQLVVNIIRKRFPDLKGRVIEGDPKKIMPEGLNPTGWDTRKSFEIFGEGWGYKDLETSVVDTVECLLELEGKWKGEGK
jgi:nucleoside-diphosphate-sugar epimerase